jgi:hypothetical protein
MLVEDLYSSKAPGVYQVNMLVMISSASVWARTGKKAIHTAVFVSQPKELFFNLIQSDYTRLRLASRAPRWQRCKPVADGGLLPQAWSRLRLAGVPTLTPESSAPRSRERPRVCDDADVVAEMAAAVCAWVCCM